MFWSRVLQLLSQWVILRFASVFKQQNVRERLLDYSTFTSSFNRNLISSFSTVNIGKLYQARQEVHAHFRKKSNSIRTRCLSCHLNARDSFLPHDIKTEISLVSAWHAMRKFKIVIMTQAFLTLFLLNIRWPKKIPLYLRQANVFLKYNKIQCRNLHYENAFPARSSSV